MAGIKGKLYYTIDNAEIATIRDEKGEFIDEIYIEDAVAYYVERYLEPIFREMQERNN